MVPHLEFDGNNPISMKCPPLRQPVLFNEKSVPIASNEPATRIGLPETTLGLIPAWGGSTRLPRLIGEQSASEVILMGKLYSAAEALKIGLVDEVVSRDQLLTAARRKLGEGKKR